LQEPSSQLFTSALRAAISILAPELVVMTGDLTRSPYDRPSEYALARAWFSTLGIPAIISSGNHDSGNMGLFSKNFGPQSASISWGGTRFITFRSDMPIPSKVVSTIARDLLETKLAGQPSFLACHVPLVDVFARQTQGSSAAIIDAILRANGTAILQGHNHYNLVMDAATALDRYRALGTQTGTIVDACEFTTLSGEAMPGVNGPKLVITTTGGYDGRDELNDAWPSYIPTAGYRVVTMANNRIANYTYDMDGDGARDASYAQPLFDFTAPAGVHDPMLAFSLAYDPFDLESGATCVIFNNLTETILAARAAIVLPINSTHRWQPIAGPIAVHERARFSNGTHEFIDLRLHVSARNTATIQLQFVPT
ncbi:MAG: hypothetical protein GYA24_02040, partial [Candidatus Lokiarchaeota archaeon]|nr:hypothetical protein [Candidatus Lokiarchaeota archaeon]